MLVGAKDPKNDAEGTSTEFTSRLSSLLLWMGDYEKIFYCGGLGSGLAAKICNNYLSCTILLANAEAMATGVKLGLDPKLLHRVIANSTGQNFMCDNVCPVPGVVPHAPSSNDYKLGFKAQMLSKDVGLGVDAANSVGVKPSIGEAAIRVFDQVGQDERCIVSTHLPGQKVSLITAYLQATESQNHRSQARKSCLRLDLLEILWRQAYEEIKTVIWRSIVEDMANSGSGSRRISRLSIFRRPRIIFRHSQSIAGAFNFHKTSRRSIKQHVIWPMLRQLVWRISLPQDMGHPHINRACFPGSTHNTIHVYLTKYPPNI